MNRTDAVIDRLAPTRRPNRRPVMYQRWAELCFLHWTIPAETLRPLLPPELELDTFEGRAYVGLVPFTMTGIRPKGLPAVRLLSNFHEINVRTYVHYQGRDPGVWFFSLDAANTLAVRLARAWFRLPYYRARMQLRIEKDERFYESERLFPAPLPAHCRVRYAPVGEVAPAQPDTLEHFLAERYLLYAKAGASLYRGQVYHSPYPLQTARAEGLEETLLAAAGVARPEAPPLAHYAREVQVEVFGLERVA